LRACLRDDRQPGRARRAAGRRAVPAGGVRRRAARRAADRDLEPPSHRSPLDDPAPRSFGGRGAARRARRRGAADDLRATQRAGRRNAGLALYVAGEDALDQVFCRHPGDFLERPVEAAILDHENERIQLAHLLAAAYEVPLSDTDAGVFGELWHERAETLVGL